jgi:hypothetical protein
VWIALHDTDLGLTLIRIPRCRVLMTASDGGR